MGICFPKAIQRKYKAEPLNLKPSAVVPTSASSMYCDETPEVPTPTEPAYSEAERILTRVQLIGDMLCPFTLRVQIALQFKGAIVDPTWLNLPVFWRIEAGLVLCLCSRVQDQERVEVQVIN